MPSHTTSAASSIEPVRVFFPCTGLGHQMRGFETFTVECAEALRHDPSIELSLFAGARVADADVRVLRILRRDSRGAALLAALHGKGAYFSEQLTFFLSLLPYIRREQPHVVYFADLNLGNLCWHWRNLSGARFRLLYYNGGLTTRPFTRTDLVQQLTPAGFDEAIARGEDARRQVVLPHGVTIPLLSDARADTADRSALGLPQDRRIVLSVGLLDNTIKRMDYVIREIAALAEPRPFLVLLGTECGETAEVRKLAVQLLGSANVMIRTVSHDEITRYFRAADVFILASMREGFGLAYVEALAHGLPVVAHDSAVTRYLLEGFGLFRNLSVPGEGAKAVADALAHPLSNDERTARHASARNRFGWHALRAEYSAMLHRAAVMPMIAR